MRRRLSAVALPIILVVLSVSLGACGARRPVLYPNARVEQVGQGVAQADVEECMDRAKEYARGGGREAEVARSTAIGAGTGAAIGAVGGAVSGAGAGQGAAVGAATGGTAGLMQGMFGVFGKSEPEPIYRNFVDRCLSGKGYEVIGWE
jgi:hypothetical protein